jgi:hypothetical protein
MTLRFASLCTVFLLVVLLGAGCGRSKTPGSLSGSSTGSDVYLPPPADAETEEQVARRELREALQNFREAKTFRAKFSLQTKDGPVSGQIDVTKPDRFRGTVTAPKDGKTETSEVIGVASSFYIKLGPDVWTYVKNQKQAALLTKAFRSAVDGSSSALSAVIPDSATVTRSKNPTLSCQVYTTTLNDEAGNPFKMTVCVAAGLPKRIEIFPSEGSITIDYFDFNKMFVIERPLGIRP